MVIQIVFIFLILMVALAMFGKFRVGKLKKKGNMKCPKCGKYLIGNGTCRCR